ncbi:MAG: helix-turn-helix domain-containing protein [Roseburia sp.]|nr:helix-turn-helix domain-containing protein [Ruminococcus sp.]MCM1155347.1 helix-turn-helix domain-containing protein [Roseburia sp.]MCM1241503.1 helix-turn-helix domain-containing protein [Roseburia sp.]
MDQVKIGKFIADRRRLQGLTQKQLADQLSVTDKTISKWETGYRLPDASILPELASVLKVDINELLAGEKFLSKEFSSKEYIQKSESNLVGLVSELNEMGQRSRSRNIGIAAGIVLISLAVLYLFAFSLRMGKFLDVFDFPTLIYLLGLQFLILSISGWFHDYLNAWKTCLPRRELSGRELKSAIDAMRYAGDLTLTLGCFIFSLSLFSLLNYRNDTDPLWPSLAQSILVLLYTAIEKTIYVILIYRLKRMLRN